MLAIKISYTKATNPKPIPFIVHLGDPEPNEHPFSHQSQWVSSSRGGVIPQETMDCYTQLRRFADKHQLIFLDLCEYALSRGAPSPEKKNLLIVQETVLANQKEFDRIKIIGEIVT